ncbi:DUF58 domain-containing protein [bacterium]|nr:DUF58 domain-containing protein [candidate division CSSED10-310 bacterium]
MISTELRKKIRRIEITTNRLVNQAMAGQYLSAFKGRGMEFSEVREYIAGDDIRSIDWNVTARYNKPFVKRYVEERELTVLFLIDISGSQGFGSSEQLKSELAAEICAILAFSAIKNNDQVGSILFSDRIESFIPPQKGATHVLRVVRDILFTKPEGRNTQISAALEYLIRVQKKRAVVFLVSDFLDTGYRRPLYIVNRHHDLVAIQLQDPREFEVPGTGWFTLSDTETGMDICVDFSRPVVREEFRRRTDEISRATDRILSGAGIDHLKLRTDIPYESALYRFLQARARRMR